MEKEKTLYGGSIKRILALILCFTMLAGCLPMLAFAEEETAQGSSMLECVYPKMMTICFHSPPKAALWMKAENT